VVIVSFDVVLATFETLKFNLFGVIKDPSSIRLFKNEKMNVTEVERMLIDKFIMKGICSGRQASHVMDQCLKFLVIGDRFKVLCTNIGSTKI